MRETRAILLCFVVLGVACQGTVSAPDAREPDAGLLPSDGGDLAGDAGGPDAGLTDTDAGPAPADAGTPPDGGTPSGDAGITVPPACGGVSWYLSPSGADSNAGTSVALPFRSFGRAFAAMAAGDTLVLLDGTYSEAAGTGTLNWTSSAGGQVLSGVDVGHMTCVMAQHPGSVRVMGGLFVGRSFRKDRFILIDGLTFEGGPSSLYNSDSIVVRNTGFISRTNGAGGILGTGSNDGDWGNTNLLFEDVWIGGQARIGLLVYRSDHVVVRRAVIHLEGCASHTDECGNNTGNAVVGSTIYNSHHVSFQNVLHLDSRLGPGGYSGAADIQTAWHDNFFFPFGANSWLGVVSLNSQLAGMYPEVDDLQGMTAHQPLFTFKDIVVVGAASGVSAQSPTDMARKDLVIDGLTVVVPNGATGDAVRVGPQFSGVTSATNSLRNVIALGAGRFGVNSAVPPSHVDVFGTFSQGAYNQTQCVTGCYTTDPRADGPTPSLRYPVRIEAGSFLADKGFGGGPLGATIVNRYGTDGTFFGQAGYDTLSATPLWPWPNQVRLVRELCPVGNTAGVCGATTLSHYIWESLGSSCPAGVCQ
ncbi:MAG: hypothetical protein Q8L48_27640 [Archangium sp.]|nr:hypothetical protein [Archangium sp.]